ncbi:MAG: hypothetical protein AB1345_10245 [Chloroflexota bacterium]
MAWLIRSAWLEENNYTEDGRLIPELEALYKPLLELNTSELRKMSREVKIPYNPLAPENLKRLRDLLRLPDEGEERLMAVLDGGIPHQVLNARKHTEESQIIARAGDLGAVTIATNMAGRGVDIKLGGELAEDVLAIVNRVLRKSGYAQPYEMTFEERRQALLELKPEEFGIYESQIKQFLEYMEDMEKVKALGGLHVIGSERHEARRIDNQLRGRSARQGDPGSSRFYLSLEDELMRLFGGQQVDGLMQRMGMDDAVPIEHNIVGRIIEQAQSRVEGANFDTRKHLLEYDDVLNAQRATIYSQRDRIMTKEDLSEDVGEMLREEVERRVLQAYDSDEGPWMLLRWLEQVQPPLVLNGTVFPTYTMELLNKRIMRKDSISVEEARRELLELTDEALQAEMEHHLNTVNGLLDVSLSRLEAQLKERLETLDTFLEGVHLDDEMAQRNPRELQAELTSLLQMPLKLSAQEWRELMSGENEVGKEARAQVESTLTATHLKRLVGAVERRLDESLDIDLEGNHLRVGSLEAQAEQILEAVQEVFDNRRERYIGEGLDGTIAADIGSYFKRNDRSTLDVQDIYKLLMRIPQGARATFDRKTHRRVWRHETRFTYTFLAARLLKIGRPEEMIAEVITHLEKALTHIRKIQGLSEWTRLASYRPIDLEPSVQSLLSRPVEVEEYETLRQQPLREWPDELRSSVVDALGCHARTHGYRQILLNVISQVWVDYLTQMEALRVSIGLEAYAQRDPLVQYKTKSYELFNQLLEDIRQEIVPHMFIYQSKGTGVARMESHPPSVEPSVKPPAEEERKTSKRKRGRRRRR